MIYGEQNLKTISRDPEYGKFDFMSKWPIFGGLSLVAVVVSLILIFTKGFNYGIDFAGGTEVQVKFKQGMKVSDLRELMGTLGFKSVSIQSFGDAHEFLIRVESQGNSPKEISELSQKNIQAISSGLLSHFKDKGPEIRRVDNVGPQIGSELKRNGILAAFYSLLAILLYVSLRFDYIFAPGAVLCLFHDSIFTLGVFSLLGKEVNVQTMAAILTIIGYSLNDTIINFDRMRENLPRFKKKPLSLVINRSVNDVISRTILTSVTTILAVAAMYFIAGGVIRDLAFTLGIGIIVGTYSTLYVASPLVLIFDKLQKKYSGVQA